MADYELAYPKLVEVHQTIHAPRVADPGEAVDETIENVGLLEAVAPGEHVIIAAGSRGIPNYGPVIARLVERIRSAGARASLLPAMGSHGGGTASGQVQILADMGLTEERIGASVIDTMHVAELGTSPAGIRVVVDESLLHCHHILVVNRIKEHTEFCGAIESGWVKMMAIGFGRAQGAVETHRCAVELGYERALREVAGVYLEKLPVLGAIGLVDAPGGGSARIKAACVSEMETTEVELLKLARQITPKLPLDQIDILIVDEMGKDISGTGMDTKVIGRLMNVYEPEPERPRITRIFVRDLTPGTHGNALGIGLADFTTQRLVSKIDRHATNLNCITAVTPEKARLPMTFETERDALQAALRTIGPKVGDQVRLLWIRNTSSLVDFLASPVAAAAMPDEMVTLGHQSFEMDFTAAGDLTLQTAGDVSS